MHLSLKYSVCWSCALLCTLFAPAQGQEVVSLEDTRGRYRERIQEIKQNALQQKKELQTNYLAALLKRESAKRKAKNLDEVLAIRTEIERVEQQDTVRVFEGPFPESLENMQEILNQRIELIDRNRDSQLREFGQQVLQYGKRLQDEALTAGRVEEAVSWRNWLKDVKTDLPEAPEEEDEPVQDEPSFGIPHTLIIWNSNNSGTGLHGSKTANIKVMYKSRSVWDKKKVQLNWSKEKNLKTEVTFQVPAFDEILIEIPEWHDRGAALSEVQILKGGRIKVPIQKIEVSSVFKDKYPGKSLINGEVEPKTPFQGYWLAKPQKESWVRLLFVAP